MSEPTWNPMSQQYVEPKPGVCVVLSIGCLECGNPSNLLGVYPTAEAAKAAHPEASQRADMGEFMGSGWWGDEVTVIFDLPS